MYNNGHQASLEMIPIENLYGRRCRTLVSWDNIVKKIMLHPKMLKEVEQEVAKIR